MSTSLLMVLSTVPDQATADRIAAALVEAGLAACVNIVPGLQSVYRWKGETRRDSELLLLIKTRSRRLAEVEALITGLHPYELPEVVAVPISDGLPAYLAWVAETTE